MDPPEAPEPDSLTTDDEHDDDVSPGTLQQEVEQTSETLDMLERIASLQQQPLEHQESRLPARPVASSSRPGLVAVIIAGVAPLVEAEPHDRLLVVLWTVAAIAVAGLVYYVVRRVQGRK